MTNLYCCWNANPPRSNHKAVFPTLSNTYFKCWIHQRLFGQVFWFYFSTYRFGLSALPLCLYCLDYMHPGKMPFYCTWSTATIYSLNSRFTRKKGLCWVRLYPHTSVLRELIFFCSTDLQYSFFFFRENKKIYIYFMENLSLSTIFLSKIWNRRGRERSAYFSNPSGVWEYGWGRCLS